MKVLITGITGFAGSHLADLLLSQKARLKVCGLSRGTSRPENLAHLGKSVELYPCDLMDPAGVLRIFKKIRPDRVVHLAGQAYSAGPADAASKTLRENILGGLYVLEAARAAVPKARVLMAGSGEEYGVRLGREKPVREDAELKPLSPYGVSKVALDLLAYQVFRNDGLHTIRARPFNHTGPRQKNIFAASSFALQIARIEAGLQDPVIRAGNLEAARDFTDVRDVVRAYWMLLQKGRAGEAYNICSGRLVKIGRLLDICLAKSRIKIKIRKDATRLRAHDHAGVRADASKLKKETGWEPLIPLEKTLSDLLDHWRERIDRTAGSKRKN